jgi:hypothetical protein
MTNDDEARKFEIRNRLKFKWREHLVQTKILNYERWVRIISHMKHAHFATVFLAAIVTALTPLKSFAAETGIPKIQFETNFVDFGKITAMESISGTFKFKNAGDAVLKVDPPQASCDCTEPRVRPDTIAPGETGEIAYTIKLERPITGQRSIGVHSNDPQNPAVQLKIQLDYTPLFELSPKAFWITVPAGKDEVVATATISRNDGKPLGIDRFTASQEWIKAAFDPPLKPDDTSARVSITVRRPSQPPAPFAAKVQMWMPMDRETRSVQSITVGGEILGEVSAVPSRLYWVIPDFGTNKSAYPTEALTRKIELTSVLGHEVKIEKAGSDIKGMSVQIVPKEGKDAGKKFDLLLRFDELPEAFTNGKVTVETALASLPRLEVPLTIAVAK